MSLLRSITLSSAILIAPALVVNQWSSPLTSSALLAASGLILIRACIELTGTCFNLARQEGVKQP